MSTVAINDVQVVDRHRTDLGDIAGLAESMRGIGQLQPIVVTPELRLVAGERRLAAARELGWTEIEAKIVHDLVDAAHLLRAERDENTCRKAFTPTEEHSLYEALLSLERPIAEEHQKKLGRNHGDPSGNFPQGSIGRAKESVAEIVTGNAGRYKTMDKVGEIKRIATDQGQPVHLREVARDALIEIDRTGKVSGPHTRVKIAERAVASRDRADPRNWTADEQSLLRQVQNGQTIVVSLRERHADLVRWAQAEGLLVPVDRRTEWGNPFEMPHDGDRDIVIANYAEHYLPHKPSLLSRIPELRGRVLACWCAPQPCHADVLKARADE